MDFRWSVAESISRYPKMAFQSKHELSTTVYSEYGAFLTVSDKGHLNKLVRNLATNALRHTPEGGTITVSLNEQDGQAVLVVDNDGQQIPDADLPRLWDPFYRVDKARNRTDGGTGLGLTIVRAAVLAHGGTCKIENRPGGVRFLISFLF